MRKNIFMLMTGIILLSSCQQNLQKESLEEMNLAPKTGKLTVQIQAPSTTITKVNIPEKLISHLTVYIFNQDGGLDAAQEIANQASITIQTSIGQHKDIYAIANYQSGANISKKDDLQNMLSHLTDNTTKKGTVLCGKLEDIEITDNKNISIPVTRLLSKISLKKIENKLTDLYWRKKTFKVKQVYLTNVATAFPLFYEDWKKAHSNNDYVSDSWCNKMKWETNSQTDEFTYQSVEQNIVNKSNYTPSSPITFYPYPNLCTSAQRGGTWSERQSRIVIEVLLGSETFYYNYTFPKILPNHHYIINNFSITKRGSKDPEQPAPDCAANFDIVIEDWIANDIGEVII